MSQINLDTKSILITGGAGFIGSNLLDEILENHCPRLVRVLDNLSSGKLSNIQQHFPKTHFEFVEGDIRDIVTCKSACRDIDIVFHLAAFVSVPLSVENPVLNNEINVNGTLNMMLAAMENRVERFVYASSASVYGTNPMSPKSEQMIRNSASPYALSKSINEDYAELWNSTQRTTRFVGMRFFNVYGPRQDSKSPYSGVISRFIDAIRNDKPIIVYGDGNQCRDFVYVQDVAQALILAAVKEGYHQVYNVGTGREVSVLYLIRAIELITGKTAQVEFAAMRAGDVRTSVANVHYAWSELGYRAQWDLRRGLERTLESI